MSVSNVEVTLNHLISLKNGITVAQGRGAYTLEESAALLNPVKSITGLINTLKKQQEEKEKAEEKAEEKTEEKAEEKAEEKVQKL